VNAAQNILTKDTLSLSGSQMLPCFDHKINLDAEHPRHSATPVQ
jgi:hypothetical protein